MVLAVAVHAANVHDSVGARPLLSSLGWDEYPRLETVFADAAYQGTLGDFELPQFRGHGVKQLSLNG